MAKEKFNISNLLPPKPIVVRSGATESLGAVAVMDKAVQAIHRAPAQPEEPEPPATAPTATKKVSFDLPIEYYRFIKMHCLDRDISMREYLMQLIEADYARRAVS